MKPKIIVNFKTYRKGKEALKLAQRIQKVSKEIIVGVDVSDIYLISHKTKLKVYAEHVDYFMPGRYTGFIIPEEVKAAGAVGTFLNHSEHKLKFGVLRKTMKRCNEAGLKTAVFASSLKEAKKIEKLRPDYLIYEPPELVGGKISVSSAKPEVIKKISKALKMKFYVGAGVKNTEDVKKSLELGAVGVAVSSGVVLARNPEKVLKEFLRI